MTPFGTIQLKFAGNHTSVGWDGLQIHQITELVSFGSVTRPQSLSHLKCFAVI